MNIQQVKERTLELYKSLPQNKPDRMARLDVRDEVMTLNKPFFTYLANHTFVSNTSISFEDKLQSALLHFCECWWWYLWNGEGDPKHKGYRMDLSFTVFFKLRMSEMIQRDLNTVKMSPRRSLLILAGEQLGKHWAKVRYEDLANVNLPIDKMNALKAMFGVPYSADLETHALYIEAPVETEDFDYTDDKYDDLEELLIREMIEHESQLNSRQLNKIAEIYSINIQEIKDAYPRALERLYKRLHDNMDNRWDI